ncbi:MAG: NADH-quinone oxidoreductase subunit NuoN [Actinomycetota bacterium]|nr:NADH-quinone oxidoreductase subunit NuoN [Actinomycetota bacterium]
MLVLFGAAAVGVLAEAFVPRQARRGTQVVIALLGLVGSLVAVIYVAGRADVITAGNAVAVDGPALFIEGILAALGIASVLLLADRSSDGGGHFVADAAITVGSVHDRGQLTAVHSQTEVFPLTTFALAGMMLFASANDLLLMFVALEVLSLPLYLLCGLARRRRLLSQEAAVKYFLLGAFASAFFLYGVALLYGYAGSVQLRDIYRAAAGSSQSDLLLLLGLAMLIIGLLFKAGIAPFHSWTPDVYQGAPTPVTALMAACTKVAAFGAILRVLYVAFANTRWDWRPLIWGVAIASMVIGAVLAVTQTDVKRLLAYSSVANAGFILVGVVALTETGISSTLFYLVAYGFTTVGAFAVVTLVRDADGEATHLSQWAGLARRSPLIAAVFTFFLLAFAGIPLTSGFTSKFAVFAAAVDGGATPLVIVGVIASAVLAFPYLRIVVLMYLSDPAEAGPSVIVPGGFTSAALTLGVLATLALGIAPQPILELASNAARFVG